MITQLEARELYDLTGKEVVEFLDNKVDPEVRRSAAAGARFTHIHLGTKGPFEDLDNIVPVMYKKAVLKLKDLGYRSARIELYGESYVPRGMADNHGDGPIHTNYGIYVAW